MINYNKLKNILTAEELYLSGYFEDNFTLFDSLIDNSENLLNFINSKNEKEGSIFISSGCYAPIHEGHINIIDLVKPYVNNYLATILYPAHDSYVITKTDKWDISKRIEYFNIFNKRTDIYFDAYPALKYDNDINFTYFLTRIKTLFPNHKIYYIFGSDNFGFHLATYDTDIIGVSIKRQSCRKHLIEYKVKELCKNYIHIENNPYLDLSSTKIRNEENK